MGGLRRRHRAKGLAVALILTAFPLAACGSGTNGAGGAGGDDPSPSSSGAAQQIYTVRKGDTLNKIARNECGEKSAALSIFDANQGRLQRDGKALVDPDLIVTGWELVLDCGPAGGGARTFTAAATEPPPIPPDPGGAPEKQPVPQHELALTAPAGLDASESPCPGQTAQFAVQPLRLRLGQAAEAIELAQGSYAFVSLTESTDGAAADLVDRTGRRRPLEATSLGFELYADPEIPLGDYDVEVTAGGQSARGGVRIEPASQPDLVRRSQTEPRYDIVGGSGSVTVTVYYWRPGACDEDAEPVASRPLDLSAGVGRLLIDTSAAGPGAYCLAIGGGGPLGLCVSDRLFRVP
jgi:hypothetical protein